MFAKVFKQNPFHDSKGRFTSKQNAWKKVGSNLGSNPGGKYVHAGVKHYVKFPNAAGQVRAEEAADKMYELMGVNTLKHRAQNVGGKMASTNVWQDVQEFGRDGWKKLSDSQKQTAANAFIASALTKNWDVVGLAHDNMGLDSEGRVTIFDTGGSFKHRAMGGPKDYGPDPMPELLGMLDVTKTSGRVFAPLMRDNREMFVKAAKKLKAIPDRELKDIARSMEDDTIPANVVARKKGIMRYFGVR
jgi:hypothetical protein